MSPVRDDTITSVTMTNIRRVTFSGDEGGTAGRGHHRPGTHSLDNRLSSKFPSCWCRPLLWRAPGAEAYASRRRSSCSRQHGSPGWKVAYNISAPLVRENGQSLPLFSPGSAPGCCWTRQDQGCESWGGGGPICGIGLAAWGASSQSPSRSQGAGNPDYGFTLSPDKIGSIQSAELSHIIRTAGGPLISSWAFGSRRRSRGRGALLGLAAAMIVRAFAGAVTNTPALAAAGNAAAMAGDKAGPGDATVAHACRHLLTASSACCSFRSLALRYRRSDKRHASLLINRTILGGARGRSDFCNIYETIWDS